MAHDPDKKRVATRCRNGSLESSMSRNMWMKRGLFLHGCSTPPLLFLIGGYGVWGRETSVEHGKILASAWFCGWRTSYVHVIKCFYRYLSI